MTFDDLDDLRMTFAALAFAGEGALRYGHPSVKKCPREPPVKKWPPPHQRFGASLVPGGKVGRDDNQRSAPTFAGDNLRWHPRSEVSHRPLESEALQQPPGGVAELWGGSTIGRSAHLAHKCLGSVWSW
jgi:hypothetical protein